MEEAEERKNSEAIASGPPSPTEAPPARGDRCGDQEVEQKEEEHKQGAPPRSLPLLQRVSRLERSLLGEEGVGTLKDRLAALEEATAGESKTGVLLKRVVFLEELLG